MHDATAPFAQTPESSNTTPVNDAAPESARPEVLTWQGFGDATRQIAQDIVNSGWMPDIVVAIARGGLLPAGALAYALGVKAMGTMNVEFYTDIEETLPEPILIPPLMDISALEGKNVLVVDDVADSGKTLKMVMELVKRRGIPSGAAGQKGPGGYVKVKEARSACIFTKPRSVIEPDYMLKNTSAWINFPWSDKPPVSPEN